MSMPVSVNFPHLNITNIQMIEKAKKPYQTWIKESKEEENLWKALIRYGDWCHESKSLDSPADVTVFFEFLEAVIDDGEWIFIYKIMFPLQTYKEAKRALSFIQTSTDK
jgi:hypothetical protein